MSGTDDTDVTQLLHAAGAGDRAAKEELIQSLHGELRRLASSFMRKERQSHTLQPTALVNEAWMRLMGGTPNFENRRHFFGAAAQAMRRILVDYARERSAGKRGGDARRVTFGDIDVVCAEPQTDLLALDEALDALAKEDERLGKVVELRYFAGCTHEEIGELLGVSEATVRRDWNYAKAWLFDRMNG